MSSIVLSCEHERSIEIDPARTALASGAFEGEELAELERVAARGTP